MKIPLKPGVTPAHFWTFISLGIGGVITGALQLTAYAWAPTVVAILGLGLLALKSKGSQDPNTPAE